MPDLEKLQAYEDDVEDDRKALEQAEKEVMEATKWLEKMRFNYARSIIKLYEYTKNAQL